MCGIAGVIVWDEKYRVTRDTLQKMSAALAHRGPDGEELFITREHEPITPQTPQVAFAFRRLAILDCDERAMQPMHTPDGRYTIVFNGEIYNFRELKAELSQLNPNHAWRTTGDTEVLLMSYATWMEHCVAKLNGMFAFVVWDHRERRLFAARDRMGQKPLFINWDGRALVFASEPSRLLEKIGGTQRSTAVWLPDYLRYGYCGKSHPVLDSLIPGQCSVYHFADNPSSLTPSGAWPFFDAASGKSIWKDDSNNLPRTIKAADVAKAVAKAVNRQLVADVPVGVFLSGGIDSSIVAACARKERRIETFSIAFDDPRYDESAYALDVAKHLDTDHHSFRITPNVISDLPTLAEFFGEPFADSSSIPTFHLARETRKFVTVALSGDGGDELFGGYDRYRALRWAQWLPRWFGKLVALTIMPMRSGDPKASFAKFARFMNGLSVPTADRYDSFLRLFSDVAIKELWPTFEPLKIDKGDREIRGAVLERFKVEYRRTGNAVTAALATDRITYLPDDLLTKVDRCSMAHGLEVRSPFMDHELVQFAAGLTTDQLLKGGPKRMLREAFADDLPAWVFKRKKMGFAVPIGEWFRGPLRAMLRDNLFASDSFSKQHFQMKVVERLVDEHETQRVDHSQRLYALLMLELWWKQQP